MNEKLKAIANKAAADLIALVTDGEKKILEAWDQVEEEAIANETSPKFKMGISITLDLEKDSMETCLSFGVKHKLTANCTIPDPNQPDLVTITSGNSSTTLTAEQFSKLAKSNLVQGRKP